MTNCPHRDVQYCPLYVIAHDATHCHLGCIDGEIEPGLTGNCRVHRGLDYAVAVERVRAALPRLVPELRWHEDEAQRKAQRARNMRAAGIQ